MLLPFPERVTLAVINSSRCLRERGGGAVLRSPVPIGMFACRSRPAAPAPRAGIWDEAGGEGGTAPSPGRAGLPYHQTALAPLNVPTPASGTAARFIL